MQGPSPRYRELVAARALEGDPAQEEVAARLQDLHDALGARSGRIPFFGARPPAVKGVYLWGAVGRGKSLLMDIFFNNTAVAKKRRVHFHEFMGEIHERIAAFRAASPAARRRRASLNRKAPDDPMPPVAHDVAAAARLLCFDEFQVADIADAMILGRLFEALFAEGVVVVATSNRPPDDLYKDGLNRQLFLPFIALLKAQLDVLELKSARDYRLDRLGGAPVYYSPLTAETAAAMEAAWRRYLCGATERRETIDLKGRELIVPRAARGAARFSFDDLCARPLGAADYLALARRYDALFVEGAPALGAERRNEAKRFVTLVDALYEARAKLVLSAAAAPDALYPAGDGAFEFQRTASRLAEMQSAEYLSAAKTMPQAGEPGAAAASAAAPH